MKYLRLIKRQAKEFFSTYPAVLSGYIIYGYLFVAIIRLFLKVKFGGATLSDAYDIFSALPFMWLLAVALVKVIEIRTKLHKSQTEILGDREELRVKETQLNTMKEVVMGLQHHINNPLAIITLTVGRAKRRLGLHEDVAQEIEQIDSASKRISLALSDFSRARRYEVECIVPLVGIIAVPSKI